MKAWRNSAPASGSHPRKQSATTTQNQKDVKNEGRSGNVYENKGHVYKMTEKLSGIYALLKPFLQENAAFKGRFAQKRAFETRLVRLRMARTRRQCSAHNPALAVPSQELLCHPCDSPSH